MHKECFSHANPSVSQERFEGRTSPGFREMFDLGQLVQRPPRASFLACSENRGVVDATAHGGVGGMPIRDCRSSDRVDMTTVHPQTLPPQGQRHGVAVHRKLTDEYEDHVIAEIAEEAGRPVDEVAELFSSQLASLGAGAKIDLYLDVIAAKRVRAALRNRAGP